MAYEVLSRMENLSAIQARLAAHRAYADAATDSLRFDQRNPEPTPAPHLTATEAADLINSLVFMPEWTFEAESYTKRFQDGVKVHVVYEARNSNRDEAPAYATWIPGGARADFMIQVTDCFTRDDVARKLIEEVIMPIMSHEVREFLRYPDTLDAPFHPHNFETMRAWGTPEEDIKFGVA